MIIQECNYNYHDHFLLKFFFLLTKFILFLIRVHEICVLMKKMGYVMCMKKWPLMKLGLINLQEEREQN